MTSQSKPQQPSSEPVVGEDVEEVTKLIGQIKVSDIQDMDNGTCKITFDYDKKFKEEYKRIFGLKKWSRKHFEQQLDKAIANFAEQVKSDAGLLKLRQDIINLTKD